MEESKCKKLNKFELEKLFRFLDLDDDKMISRIEFLRNVMKNDFDRVITSHIKGFDSSLEQVKQVMLQYHAPDLFSLLKTNKPRMTVSDL